MLLTLPSEWLLYVAAPKKKRLCLTRDGVLEPELCSYAVPSHRGCTWHCPALLISLASPLRASPMQSMHQEVFDPVSGAGRG